MSQTLGAAAALDQTVVQPSPAMLLPEEREFYLSYPWSINALPSFKELVDFLRREVSRVDVVPSGWRAVEVMNNTYMLCCAISDVIDDWLLSECYDFSKIRRFFPAGLAVAPVEKWLAFRRFLTGRRLRKFELWREEWEASLEAFLLDMVNSRMVSDRAADLSRLIETRFPKDLLLRRSRIPAAFRSQDLTPHDILSLGKQFSSEFPNTAHPILVLGLRTAGSYFAPLLRAYLKTAGYQDVQSLTVRPKMGLSSQEHARIAQTAAKGALVLIIDEPVNTGGTLMKLIAQLRRAGIDAADLCALFPVHPNRTDSDSGYAALAYTNIRIINLRPERYFKRGLLDVEHVGKVVSEYYGAKGLSVQSVSEAAHLNSFLRDISELKFHDRLKGAYSIRLRDRTGAVKQRFILAKSVGWGWLGYHAFLCGERLPGLVVPVLGLRDGILYSEWVGDAGFTEGEDSNLPKAAVYIAERAQKLKMGPPPPPRLASNGLHGGLEELAAILSRAYGWNMACVLRRNRLLGQLLQIDRPDPVLIDGRMRRSEWVRSGASLLKCDFEHHGQGKTELGATDPAYDLADLILHWKLPKPREEELLKSYIKLSGDREIGRRLFFAQLLAGTGTIGRALDNLKDPRLTRRHEQFNRQYLDAFDFLTEHTTDYCASFCARPRTVGRHAPLVVLDIDGVLDKQIFGFPSTTAAGIQAISLLHTHGFPISFNSARSLKQLKKYSQAYGATGAVAEYGAVAWDAQSGKEMVLVSEESLEELEIVKRALRAIPGVFLNGSYQYSIRAFVYEGDRTAPLPGGIVRNLLAGLKVKRLRFHQTFIDTTIVAGETDKGIGLGALLKLSDNPHRETIAIGDSEPDLPMFRVATMSFAPRQIGCRQAADLLGCRIASRPWQPGLLESVRKIIHPAKTRCAACEQIREASRGRKELFLRLLLEADRSSPSLLLRAMLDPLAIRAFRV